MPPVIRDEHGLPRCLHAVERSLAHLPGLHHPVERPHGEEVGACEVVHRLGHGAGREDVPGLLAHRQALPQHGVLVEGRPGARAPDVEGRHGGVPPEDTRGAVLPRQLAAHGVPAPQVAVGEVAALRPDARERLQARVHRPLGVRVVEVALSLRVLRQRKHRRAPELLEEPLLRLVEVLLLGVRADEDGGVVRELARVRAHPLVHSIPGNELVARGLCRGRLRERGPVVRVEASCLHVRSGHLESACPQRGHGAGKRRRDEAAHVGSRHRIRRRGSGMVR
mmetsp:Transcript_13456/g.42613  ORF Transcript_13456/g.42613 Transcript_13456/m.42613 type:complete len:280 (-) Transcript_13456:11-850(-)